MVTQALSKPLTFEEFLEWYPEDGRRYELIEGEIVEMRPVGQHELIASFVDAELTLEIRRRQLPYFSSRNTLVKPNRPGSADLPDWTPVCFTTSPHQTVVWSYPNVFCVNQRK